MVYNYIYVFIVNEFIFLTVNIILEKDISTNLEKLTLAEKDWW